jgi:hypothetical protein
MMCVIEDFVSVRLWLRELDSGRGKHIGATKFCEK